MVAMNKKNLLLTFLIGLYSISNVFIYFNTSYKYQVKQINYLYSLLDETNNNYNNLSKKYDILNKKYDKLTEDIIKLNYTINTNNQICNEDKVCESNINHDFIEKIRLDLDKVDKILQDYEKVDAPALNYDINDNYLKTNPNNTIVKMFYTFF